MQKLKRLFYKGFSPYYFARKALFNLRDSSRSERKNYRPVADPSALERIHKDGWSPVQLDAEVVAKAAAYCRDVEQAIWPQDTPPEAGQGKDFWTLLVNRGNVKDHPALIEFASNKTLKDLASAYLGEEAVLSDIVLMKSFSTHRKVKHSQLWHLDADDSKLLLFYVYCRDVDSGSGPFMLLPKSKKKPTLVPRFFRKYGYTDEEISRFSNGDSLMEIVGPSGTVFACDTATTYHCGSRCEDKTRLALSIRFTTGAGLYPVNPIPNQTGE